MHSAGHHSDRCAWTLSWNLPCADLHLEAPSYTDFTDSGRCQLEATLQDDTTHPGPRYRCSLAQGRYTCKVNCRLFWMAVNGDRTHNHMVMSRRLNRCAISPLCCPFETDAVAVSWNFSIGLQQARSRNEPIITFISLKILGGPVVLTMIESC